MDVFQCNCRYLIINNIFFVKKQTKRRFLNVYSWLKVPFVSFQSADIEYEIVKDKIRNKAELKLININHTYVGYYYCMKAKWAAAFEYDALHLVYSMMPHDKVYLFVNGYSPLY